jgi:hypothetical protein
MQHHNINHTQFNNNNLIIKPAKTNTKGLGATLRAFYKYDDEEIRFRTQTPKMVQAFELGADKRDDGSIAYSINLSFRGDEDNIKLENFRKMLEQMDEHNITFATENSESIFGKKKSREVIEENYTPMVKYSKKPGYRPILKVKLPVYDEKPSFRVFNKEREMIPIYSETEGVDLSVFAGGSEAVHLLEFTGLWKTNNKFGGSWKLVQSKMYTTKQLAGYMMDDSDEDD